MMPSLAFPFSLGHSVALSMLSTARHIQFMEMIVCRKVSTEIEKQTAETHS